VTIDAHPQPPTSAGVAFQPVPRGLEIFLNPYRMSDNYQTDPAPNRSCVLVSPGRRSQLRFTAVRRLVLWAGLLR
jgi:hypothetical protein